MAMQSRLVLLSRRMSQSPVDPSSRPWKPSNLNPYGTLGLARTAATTGTSETLDNSIIVGSAEKCSRVTGNTWLRGLVKGLAAMKHVFISHAGKDSAIAERLHGDLRNVGHDVRIDLHELTLGDDTIDFMNNEIAQAHTVIVIFSQNTPEAKWQKLEINAAVWNETEQEGGKVIVLKVDSCKLPPLLGPKLFGSLEFDKYQETLQKLSDAIVPKLSDTSLVCEALKEGSANPFWRVRAEYFEEMPALLASAFSPPDAAKVTILEEMKPCFLEGSRGTGKTMLLLSLRARILASRPSPSKSLEQLFGFYLRLDRGAFCNAGVRAANDGLLSSMDPLLLVQLTDTFAQEFYLAVHESLLSEITFCVRDNKLLLDTSAESQLVKEVAAALYGSTSPPLSHLDELLIHFADLHRRLSEFIRRKFIYQEQVSVPFACFDLVLFKRVLGLIKKAIPSLSRSHITVLLDEYENLFPYQKLVVNSLIKLGPPQFSVKVARKVGTDETSATTVGQELQETHDYNRIPLIYSVEDSADFSRYLSLLESMVTKLLAPRNQTNSALAALLPADDSDEVSSSALEAEVLALLKMSPSEFASLNESEQAAKYTYYREAGIYRLLYGKPGRRTLKRFSGHRDLAFISSGVIRYFQEILGLAWHLQVAAGGPSSVAIDPTFQSQAVHAVSNHNLATLSRNVETHGEQLKYFLLDLGDCLRQKLLRHTSEPEAARIAIRDPQLLKTQEFLTLDLFLNLGVKEGVFQTVSGRPGIRPKHVEDPQPVEVNVSRIFVPALQISPRLRWTTQVNCSDLLGLLNVQQRRIAKSRLLKRLAKDDQKVDQPLLRPYEDENEASL